MSSDCNSSCFCETDWDDRDKQFVIRVLTDQCGQCQMTLLQNANGPCPLLAIANVLLLRGELSLPDCTIKRRHIHSSELVHRLYELVFRYSSCSVTTGSFTDTKGHNLGHMEKEVLSVLPTLTEGMDVNCRFSEFRSFQDTQQLSIFEFFCIPLVHGWVAEKSEEPLFGCLGPSKMYSYNDAVYIAACHSEALQLMEDLNAELTSERLLQEHPCFLPSPDLSFTNDSEETEQHGTFCRSYNAAKPYHSEVHDSVVNCSHQPSTVGSYNCSPSLISSADPPLSKMEVDVAVCAVRKKTASDVLQVRRFLTLVNVCRRVGLTCDYAKDIEQFLKTCVSKSESPSYLTARVKSSFFLGFQDTVEAFEKRLATLVERLWTILSSLWSFKTSAMPQVSAQDALDEKNRPMCLQPFTLAQFLTDGWKLRQFLENTAEQFTNVGLEQIRQGVPETTYAVLYRNCHFTTIQRVQRDVYQLVTDFGFAQVPNVMWERIDGVRGKTTYFSVDLIPLSSVSPQTNVAPSTALSTRNKSPTRSDVQPNSPRRKANKDRQLRPRKRRKRFSGCRTM